MLSEDKSEKRGTLPVRFNRFQIVDESDRRLVEVHAGSASLLKNFPMPVMGCGLNSGAASWDCFIGFMRGRSTPIAPGGASGAETLASALGLHRSDDHASRASGVEVARAFGEEADSELIEKEMAMLERMLSQPSQHQKESWFWHLPNRPDVIAPLAPRIFEALGFLQSADVRGSETGRNLWRLVAALPEEALAPHRAKMVEWLKPENARPWTEQTYEVFARLDGNDPVEREIILHRLETKRGDLEGKLLTSFCRMGGSAPEDVKRRLLALWHKRGADPRKSNGERSYDDVPLYFTLARLGLKEQAGKVEQRYYGPTFLGIWEEVNPDFPDDLCAGSTNDISNRFKRR